MSQHIFGNVPHTLKQKVTLQALETSGAEALLCALSQDESFCSVFIAEVVNGNSALAIRAIDRAYELVTSDEDAA